MKYRLVLGTGLFILLSATAALGKSVPPGPEILDEDSFHMPWEYDLVTYPLEESRGSVHLLPGYALLRGPHAQKFLTRIQDLPPDRSEAVLLNPETGSQWVFSYYPTGYIALDTWNRLDANLLLKNMAEAARIENGSHREQDIPDLTVTEWLQPPSLDRENRAVSWAVGLLQDGRRVVNAIALKLGRHGFEKMTWVGTHQEYTQSRAMMAKMVRAHKFAFGSRYEDFKFGDPLSRLDLPQLVALMTGGKVAVQSHTEGLGASFWTAGKIFLLIPALFMAGIAVLLVKKFGTEASPQAQAPSGS